MTPAPSPKILNACADAGRRSGEATIERFAKGYQRERDLKSLVPTMAPLASRKTAAATVDIIEGLECAADNLVESGAATTWGSPQRLYFNILGAIRAERRGLAELVDQTLPAGFSYSLSQGERVVSLRTALQRIKLDSRANAKAIASQALQSDDAFRRSVTAEIDHNTDEALNALRDGQ